MAAHLHGTVATPTWVVVALENRWRKGEEWLLVRVYTRAVGDIPT